MRIGMELYFAMAHRLYPYEGKCRNIHGHTYRVQLELEGKGGDFVVDFGEIKRYFDEEWDHRFVVSKDDPILKTLDGYGLKVIDRMPTCENLVRILTKEIKERFGLEKVKVRLWESPTSWAEAFG